MLLDWDGEKKHASHQLILKRCNRRFECIWWAKYERNLKLSRFRINLRVINLN